jgi:PAS domain S-box-containing protein
MATPTAFDPDRPAAFTAERLFAGGGEMGALMRAHDWTTSPLGPPEGWPASLRSAVSICLGSAFPIALYWGPELALLYNDAWSPIPGGKHPWALGRPGREVWPEIWDTIGPLFAHVMSTGEATRSKDQLLAMRRHGYTEECYFDYTFSPIRGDAGQVEGIFNAVLETTERVIGERRLRTVRELAARVAEARTPDAAYTLASQTLAGDPGDLPFALLYRVVEGDGALQLVGTAGLAPGTPASPTCVPLAPSDGGADAEAPRWPLAEVARTGRVAHVSELEARFGALPGGPWPESPRDALVLPITRPGREHPFGAMVVGLSPRRALDDAYRGFLDLLAGHIGQAITNAEAYEAERVRAEALAELDRAKTTFFSNVSHEFRTPLTLMLGPAEDALADPETRPENRARLLLVHRNALRLLRLVNSLLDFARIEAGRIEAVYEPTDVAVLTAELASAFRSACARAGLALTVDAPPLPVGMPAVYVDHEMWEKVVLNLLSNAFKHTFAGGISVRVRAVDAGDGVEVTVADTGVGIAPEELPRIFDRFHRVANARSRTHEGTGIGLALVQELVHRHGGSIAVASTPGEGTTFTVRLRAGAAHLPAERLATAGAVRASASTAIGAMPYAEEAVRWLPGTTGEHPIIVPSGRPPAPAAPPAPVDAGARAVVPDARVLLADDNADMREYVTRLLTARGWEVEGVPDGRAALDAARARRPDLVLSDVMMPRLDGFGLLRELRADEALRDLPVILLSARAGEEARVEGAQAGADDYLVKPFAAQELVARVGAHLSLARLRRETETTLRESEARFRNMADHAPVMLWVTEADGSCSFLNREWYAFTGQSPEQGLGFGWLGAVHPDDRARAEAEFMDANARHASFRVAFRLRRADGEYRRALDAAAPRFGADGEFLGYIGSVVDVEERERLLDAERAARQEAEAARAEAEAANRAKSEFLAVMSHELRTPLNAIGGYAELLEMGVRGPVNEAQREDLTRIQKSQQHLLGLINDVLNYARVETGTVRYSMADVPVDETIATAEALVAPQVRAKGLSLDFGGCDRTLTVRADAEKLRQILLNLLTNAVKFTAPGGRIAIGCDVAADRVRIAVADTGIGVSPDKLASIFEPFVQVNPRLTRTQDGVGLGLAISRDLARGMGGDLTVESEEGVGSTFTLTLAR